MYYRSANLIITACVMGALAIAAVGLRFWAKRIRKLRVEVEDYLIIVGLILALGLCICNIIGAVDYRFGDHEIFIEDGDLAGWPEAWLLLGYGKIFYAIQLLHTTAMPVIKASLMLFLNRIFGQNKKYRIVLWVIGVYVFLWWFTTFWMSVFQCWPLSSNWGTTPAELGNCIPDYPLWYSLAALLNVVSDVAIIFSPLPFVLRLHMPRKQKFATIATLATAVVVIAAGIGRTVAYFTYDHNSFDYTYVFYDFLIWTPIEACLGVVGCCLPIMRPFFDIQSSAIYSGLRSALSRRSLLSRSSPQRTGASGGSGGSGGNNNRSTRRTWFELRTRTPKPTQNDQANGSKPSVDKASSSEEAAPSQSSSHEAYVPHEQIHEQEL